jgi:PAT family beta-lactamase induction signal transducer AmpG
LNSWSETFEELSSPEGRRHLLRVVGMLFLGFSAGVPILLVFSTFSIWLREAGVERATIGFFSWAALAYGFKFLWAPVVDRLPLPLLARAVGQRRSWMLLAQAGIICALVLQANNDPASSLTMAAALAVMLAISSATQDIVIDAYRIEAVPGRFQGLMSATYIMGYRLGMIAAGAGALQIAGFLDPDKDSYQHEPWTAAWLVMAAIMSVGVVTTLIIREPRRDAVATRTDWPVSGYLRFLALFAAVTAAFFGTRLLIAPLGAAATLALAPAIGNGLAGFTVGVLSMAFAVGGGVGAGVGLVIAGAIPRRMAMETYVDPFLDFFRRYGRIAVLILALIALYRIADVVMGVMANVFYVDLGFEKQVIGLVSGFYGILVTIAGGIVGGLLIIRYGVIPILFAGGLLAAGTNVLFAVLAVQGKMLSLLMVVIAADNLSGGLAAASFVAYLSSLTSVKFTAMQYALFSSLMLLLPKLLAGYSGVAVDAVDYPAFFVGTALLGIPVLFLIVIAARAMPVDN